MRYLIVITSPLKVLIEYVMLSLLLEDTSSDNLYVNAYDSMTAYGRQVLRYKREAAGCCGWWSGIVEQIHTKYQAGSCSYTAGPDIYVCISTDAIMVGENERRSEHDKEDHYLNRRWFNRNNKMKHSLWGKGLQCISIALGTWVSGLWWCDVAKSHLLFMQGRSLAHFDVHTGSWTCNAGINWSQCHWQD